ncbi:hypothetical protein Tco_1210079 [Tanacetum coccineum]
MSRKGLKFSGRITPLFSNMLASAEVKEGEDSSSGPDNTHSPSMNLEGTGGNKGDQVRVLALETTKDAQAIKILKLKTQMKKLEKKCKPSVSHHRAWLKSMKMLSMKKRVGKKEYVSKQGKKDAKTKTRTLMSLLI